MKRRRERSVPLQLLLEYKEKYPKVWETLNASYEMANNEWRNGRDIDFWNKNIHTPKTLCQASLMTYYPGQFIKTDDPHRISTLAAWRDSKEVFVVDPDTEAALLETEYDGTIPTDVLMRLPFYCFYVQTNSVRVLDEKIDGFFVCLDTMDKADDYCLRIMTTKGGKFFYYILLCLSEPTIEKSIDRILKGAFEYCEDRNEAERLSHLFKEEVSGVTRNIIQILLYILSANSDVNENKKKEVRRPGVVKDKATEIRVWDVGTRVGAAFRKTKKGGSTQSNSRDHGETVGIKKRPHIRRAHWHHFWTGKRDSDERKLIVKWVPPTAINIDGKSELPVVIHNVE